MTPKEWIKLLVFIYGVIVIAAIIAAIIVWLSSIFNPTAVAVGSLIIIPAVIVLLLYLYNK